MRTESAPLISHSATASSDLDAGDLPDKLDDRANRPRFEPVLCFPAVSAVRFRLQLRDGRVFEGAGLRVGGEYLAGPEWTAARALDWARWVLQGDGAQVEVIIGEGGARGASRWFDAADVASVDLADLCEGCGGVIPRHDARLLDGFAAWHFECAPPVNR
jgi:hypothetical protein